MKIIVLCFIIWILFPSTVLAQNSTDPNINYKEEFFKAEVIQVLEDGEKRFGEITNPYQKIKLKLLDGPQKDTILEVEHGNNFTLKDDQKVKVGEKIVLLHAKTSFGDNYQIIDKYRLDEIIKFILVFFVLIIAISRFRGIGSILGLIISLLVIVKFIVPQIVEGKDPILISIIGSLFIMITTIYLAHGFSKRTSIAVASTFLSLCLTGVLALIFVSASQLSGLGSEEAYNLTFGALGSINFKGLLLAGMIIGTLGILDDITTSQSAAIFELKAANKELGFSKLLKSGFAIGKEHISSLVNTLVLAYAGVALPIFIILVINPSDRPLWFLINSEFISEEIVRTLAGSIGLVLAVPITTVMAAYLVTRGNRLR